MELLLKIDPAADESYTTAPPWGRADEDAVMTIVSLLDADLAAEEILLLAHMPATEYNANVGSVEDNKLLQFAAVAQGNPYWDQAKLNFESGAAMIGYRRAKDLFAGDPALSTNLEQQRQQYSEWTDMIQGQAMPVSDRDDHIQHLQALNQKVFASLNTMRQVPPEVIPEQDLNTMKLGLLHGEAHAQAESKKPSTGMAGRTKRTKQLQPLVQQLTQANQAFSQILENRSKAQAQAAMMGNGAQPPTYTGSAGNTAPIPPHAEHGLGGVPHSLPPTTPNPAGVTGIPA